MRNLTTDQAIQSAQIIKELPNLDEAHPFTQEDWWGFAGADRFDDGTAPLMFETNKDITLIRCMADNKGIEVYIYPEGEDTLKDPDYFSKRTEGATKNDILKDYAEAIKTIKESKEDIPDRLLVIGFLQY